MADARLAPLLRHLHRLAGPPGGAELTDAQLLERFALCRDEGAFECLPRRHGPLVWRVCRRVLPGAQDAEDAFQGTFLVLARRAGAIRKPGSLSSWLHGVAYRVARKARDGLERGRLCEARAACAPACDPAREAAWRELGQALEEELHGLAEKYRAPLLLCYWEGLTNEEAARRLGWPGGTVKTRLAQARRLLHERLARRGLALPAGAVATLLAPAGVEAAVPAALGAAAPAGFSAQAIALAEGALKTMLIAKLKAAVFVLLAVGALTAAGAGALVPSSREGQQAGAEAKEGPKSAGKKAPKGEVGPKPDARAADAEFIRRITLDVCGRLPTAEEVRRFVDDKDPKKRAKLVERLLAGRRAERALKLEKILKEHFKRKELTREDRLLLDKLLDFMEEDQKAGQEKLVERIDELIRRRYVEEIWKEYLGLEKEKGGKKG
jgi:RNA polymerase sigma factor (sigma-70 family)